MLSIKLVKHPIALLLMLPALVSVVLLSGCSAKNDDEDRRAAITRQIDVLEQEIEGLEEQQTKLRECIKLFREQMEITEQELNRMSPRIFSADSTIGMLRASTLKKEPGWLYALRNLELGVSVLILLLVLWLLYRLNNHNRQNGNRQQVEQVIKNLEREASRPVTPRQSNKVPVPEPVAKIESPKPEQPRVKEKSEPVQEAKVEDIPAAAKPQIEQKPEPVKQPESMPEKPAAKQPKTSKKTSSTKRTSARRKKGPAKKCKVEGCNNKHRSKGFCNKHYQQWRRGTLTEPIED